MRHLPILSCVLLALAACATATPYQPVRNGEGYSEQKLEANRYRVSFAGNASTPLETVQNYLLYRAAELTLANGHDHFVLIDSGTEGQGGGGGPRVGIGIGGFRFGGSGGLGVSVGTSTTAGAGKSAYRVQADVLTYPGPRPADRPEAYDARELKRNLEGQIRRPAK